MEADIIVLGTIIFAYSPSLPPAVHVYDVVTGKELGGEGGGGGPTVRHQNDIVSIALSKSGPTHERLLALLDRNNDLFLTSIRESTNLKFFTLGKRIDY